MSSEALSKTTGRIRFIGKESVEVPPSALPFLQGTRTSQRLQKADALSR